jgi:hypothetical protein
MHVFCRVRVPKANSGGTNGPNCGTATFAVTPRLHFADTVEVQQLGAADAVKLVCLRVVRSERSLTVAAPMILPSRDLSLDR